MSARHFIAGAAASLIGAAGLLTATPAPASATPAPPVPGTPCTATAKACVDLSAGHAWLIKGGHAYGPATITSGKAGSETPTGTFHVRWKDKDHRSHQFHNAPMPYSVFFYPGDAFHAGSTSEESNGCIHLATASAAHFYRYLQVGDEVQIHP